ncbi:MAG: 23S rRNA (pseudouridine(1915)-N(3))-methyltransferase RlmH [Eubacterium sp.]|nr:23S rRNA (pseudouridine(1915)-N(3))-methyltransferase RlmH [Eubacterium sp.]MDD7209221.1 23S rRNA (pseudouridine(1915)-N(3))-methyltransferase RlmH [Lachnospiraceae bacterium]MDY5497953.1 23S rRNA (pseudouridine(1915)-N(3))-methyltransferase RlmH [Anaerobutyricum sp.]
MKIICVGRIKEDFFREGIGYFTREIRKKYPMEIVECQDEPTPDACPQSLNDRIRRTEGKRILEKIKEDDYVIALCIDGKHYRTDLWKKRMGRILSGTEGNVTFVIGGSLGLSDEVISRADEKLSFSALTFPHQMMRLILCEQIARII